MLIKNKNERRKIMLDKIFAYFMRRYKKNQLKNNNYKTIKICTENKPIKEVRIDVPCLFTAGISVKDDIKNDTYS